MIVSCPKCKTKFRLPENQDGEQGLENKILKCGNCHNMWRYSANSPLNEIKTFLPSDPELIDSLAHNNTSTLLRDVYAAKDVEEVVTPTKAKADHRVLFTLVALLFFYLSIASINHKNVILAKLPFLSYPFSIMGLSQTDGLEFVEVTIIKDALRAGHPFVISGYIRNNTDKIMKSPDIRISFTDREGKEIAEYTTDLPNKRLQPGEKSRITQRIKKVPEGSNNIVMDLGNYLELLLR